MARVRSAVQKQKTPMYDICFDSQKRRYPTKKVALSAASRLSLQSGLEIRAYKCGICHDYHVTKKAQREYLPRDLCPALDSRKPGSYRKTHRKLYLVGSSKPLMVSNKYSKCPLLGVMFVTFGEWGLQGCE